MQEKKNIGLETLGAGRKSSTPKPQRITPNQQSTRERTLPDDQILIPITRRLTAKETPKTAQLKLDTHAAIKQIAIIENKKMYEVMDEITEKYVKEMPSSSQKMILEMLRPIQNNIHYD